MTPPLKSYPAYKDSGVHWLGMVPEHWNVQRLSSIVRKPIKNGVGESAQEYKENWPRYVRITDISGPRRLSEKTRASLPPEIAADALLEVGDLLLAAVGATVGKSYLHLDRSLPACYAGYLVRVSPKYCVMPEFLIYWTETADYWDQVKSQVIQATIQNFSAARVKGLRVSLPPLPEQSAIVRYLDYMDSRIGKLIRAKQKLVKLLAEQKQAIISRAVTRGLRSDVPIKPSGVEWLGDVPTHWEVRHLRNATQMRVSSVDKHTKEDELPVRLCNYVNVYKNEHITEHLPFMRATATFDEIERFRLQLGDVLITKDSELWNDIGVPALVEYSALDLICGYHLALLRPRSGKLLGGYLLRALQIKPVAFQFHIEANGVTRYGLSHDAIKSVLIPIPPLPEQASIIQYIDEATVSIVVALERANRETELLREYRTRLISDVVTGKLDVREAAAGLPEEVEEEAATVESEEIESEEAVSKSEEAES